MTCTTFNYCINEDSQSLYTYTAEVTPRRTYEEHAVGLPIQLACNSCKPISHDHTLHAIFSQKKCIHIYLLYNIMSILNSAEYEGLSHKSSPMKNVPFP